MGFFFPFLSTSIYDIIMRLSNLLTRVALSKCHVLVINNSQSYYEILVLIFVKLCIKTIRFTERKRKTSLSKIFRRYLEFAIGGLINPNACRCHRMEEEESLKSQKKNKTIYMYMSLIEKTRTSNELKSITELSFHIFVFIYVLKLLFEIAC